MWFAAEPCDLDFIAVAPYRLESEVVLQAPPERVFSVLAAAESWGEWFKDMAGARWLSPPPHGVGATREVELKLLRAKERFVAWEQDRRLAFVVTESTVPFIRRFLEDYQILPAGPGRTRLRWVAYYTPHPVMRLFHPVARLLFGRIFRQALSGLSVYLQKTRQA